MLQNCEDGRCLVCSLVAIPQGNPSQPGGPSYTKRIFNQVLLQMSSPYTWQQVVWQQLPDTFGAKLVLHRLSIWSQETQDCRQLSHSTVAQADKTKCQF